MAKIADYVNAWRAHPWEWGLHDCVTFPADWVELQTGIDPMGEFRGAYTCRETAADLIEEMGGLAAMFSAARDECGALPNAGVMDWRRTQTGALYNADWIWVFTPKGVTNIRHQSRMPLMTFG